MVLTTQEHNLLKEEKQLIAKFVAHEREEREYFHLLTSAVKDSHERERIQANTTKYLSIIGSVVGTLLGMLGSTVNNYVKLKKTKDMVSIDFNFCIVYSCVRMHLYSIVVCLLIVLINVLLSTAITS